MLSGIEVIANVDFHSRPWMSIAKKAKEKTIK